MGRQRPHRLVGGPQTSLELRGEEQVGELALGIDLPPLVAPGLLPRVAQIIMNTTFRMFPDSAAAAGKKDEAAPAATPDMIAMSNLMRGIHF